MSSILDGVIVPFLHDVGERWQTGDCSIAHERLASERMSTFLRDLLRLATDDEPARERILLACFGDEEHELGLLVTGIRLATWGYRPVVLGGRLPPSALRAAVQQLEPEVVGLSLTLPPARPRARELAEEYGAACGDVPWLVGGRGAPPIADLIEKFGGRVIASEPADGLRAAVRELLVRRSTANAKLGRGASKRGRKSLSR